MNVTRALRPVLAVTLVLLAALVATGAAVGLSRGGPDGPPGRDPDLRGVVTQVEPADAPGAGSGVPQPADPDEPVSSDHPDTGGPARGVLGRVLVEELPGEPMRGEKAWVAVTEDTSLWRQEEGGPVPAAFDDLAAGREVAVWFTGPVAESYPVQATAEAVLVLAP